MIELEGNLALIDVSGVGYEVIVPDSSLPKLTPNSQVTLYTRQIIREDANFLCGFLERSDRRVFDLLLEVKGCGPKVAQALIGQVGSDAIASAILINDPRILAKASGVGTRLAERIILELKPKIDQGSVVISGDPSTNAANSDRDLVEALVSLGYRRIDAEQVASKTNPGDSTDIRLKDSLKQLQSRRTS